MPLTTDKEKNLNPPASNNIILNLAAVITWAVIGTLLILNKINVSSHSNSVGLILGFTITLLTFSPFVHHYYHKKVLAEKETEPRAQLMTNIKFAAIFVVIAAALSFLFAFIHNQFLVILK